MLALILEVTQWTTLAMLVFNFLALLVVSYTNYDWITVFAASTLLSGLILTVGLLRGVRRFQLRGGVTVRDAIVLLIELLFVCALAVSWRRLLGPYSQMK